METLPQTPEERAIRALIEIYHLTKNHPTNILKLGYGQPGYDSAVRYAYLVAKDTLMILNRLPE